MSKANTVEGIIETLNINLAGGVAVAEVKLVTSSGQVIAAVGSQPIVGQCQTIFSKGMKVMLHLDDANSQSPIIRTMKPQYSMLFQIVRVFTGIFGVVGLGLLSYLAFAL